LFVSWQAGDTQPKQPPDSAQAAIEFADRQVATRHHSDQWQAQSISDSQLGTAAFKKLNRQIRADKPIETFKSTVPTPIDETQFARSLRAAISTNLANLQYQAETGTAGHKLNTTLQGGWPRGEAAASQSTTVSPELNVTFQQVLLGQADKSMLTGQFRTIGDRLPKRQQPVDGEQAPVDPRPWW
jgi:hypothetical protein